MKELQSLTDMDELIEIHDEFLKKIIKLCFLDSKSKNVLDMISDLLKIPLEFRQLCKKYLLPSTQQEDSESSGDDETANKSIGKLGVSSTDQSLLNLESLQFVDRFNRCKQEFEQMVNSHRTRMKLLTAILKKYTKKGIFNYLNEAFIRFNFNSFYISREDEELDAV
ncbi:hypothetical protein FGO68_gene5096 [Halteria grandinella]|uniref:Gamma tubulin complex component C-terminal domain-containing protein n=1 Tax=Halteria grandinella TaxID=5974 RepID=A0A8J8NBY4_HALGN|nr:hypothetical protein FGO68_gene5096 [Halteria grandinella]